MGSQTNFYMDEQVQRNFLNYVVESGGEIWCCGWNLSREWDEPHRINPDQGIDKLNEYRKLWFYKKDFGDLTFESIENLGMHISGIFEPMIEFCKSGIVPEEKVILRGRIWVQLSYWDNRNQLVYKPEALKKWYQSLSRWIRKHLRTIETGKHERTGFVYKELISAEVQNLIEHEGYTLRG